MSEAKPGDVKQMGVLADFGLFAVAGLIFITAERTTTTGLLS